MPRVARFGFLLIVDSTVFYPFNNHHLQYSCHNTGLICRSVIVLIVLIALGAI